MTDNPQTIGKDGSSQFPDEAVRRFLLGGLNDAEQTHFEERLFADEAFETRIRLAECELADDYAVDRLNAADRELFEKYFLVSANRRQTLLVSRALRDRFSAGPARQQITIRERLWPRFALNQPLLRFAFGLVILILLVGTLWLVTKEPQIVERFVPKRAPAAPTPAPAAPREAGHPPNSTSTPVHRENFPPMPPHESVAPATVVSVGLSPNRREAANIPVVNLSRGEHDVMRFQLALQTNPQGTYRAELITDDGQLVFSSESLTADGSPATIDFDVPARLLKTGNYQIRIAGRPGSRAGGVRYYFLAQ